MNRKVLLICAATLPLLLMAVVVQTIQYQELKTQVEGQQKDQDQWAEKNRKVLAGVTVLRSPERIEALAEHDPSLVAGAADRTVKVRFPSTAREVKP